ncbi:MAG: FkbM family methyltransferase, partial [Candidatus Heimdallarchaeota archaeon]|nr:FkbM family methyltransferase [Candidatus Heimdallarchaeota archaeon]
NLDFFENYDLYFEPSDEILVFDVGAYHGDWALNFKNKFANAKIFCFEPLKSNFEVLVKKTSKTNNIITINKAISNETGQSTFHITKNKYSSSLLEPKDEFFNGNIETRLTTVDTINLLDIIINEKLDRINLLKMDIQGMEFKVLQNLDEKITMIDLIYIEVNFQPQYQNSETFFEINSYLESKNFQFLNLTHVRKDRGKAIFTEALYVNKQKMLT